MLKGTIKIAFQLAWYVNLLVRGLTTLQYIDFSN